MKKIAAVAALQISEKAIALPAALAVGTIPLLFAAIGSGREPVAEIRDVSALFLAFVVGATLAVALGFGSTAGDVASGRIAFYLARPLTALELWAGKLAGSLAIVTAATLLAVLPSALAAGGRMRMPTVPIGHMAWAFPFDAELAGSGLLAAAALIFLLAYLVSQAAGIAFLGRSGWLLADLAALAAAGAAVVGSGRALFLAGAGGALTAGAAAVVAIVAAAFAAAGIRSIARGGIDPRRSHRAQSATFWAIVAVGVATIAVAAAWVLHPSPNDIESVAWISPASRGEWIAVTGRARWRGGYFPVFLENTATGAYLSLGGASLAWPGPSRLPVISADGRAAAWTTAGLALDSLPVLTPHTLRLDSGRPNRVAWDLKDLREDPLLVFSADSSRFAIIVSDRIKVWDAERGGMLAAARPPRPLWENARGLSAATFVGRDHLRLYGVHRSGGTGKESVIDILDFDIVRHHLSASGTAGPFAHTFPILTDASRERLLVRDEPASISVLDGRSGKLIQRVSGGGALSRSADFLSDGRIALFESVGGAGAVAILSRDGVRQKAFSIGPAERAYVLGERRPGAVEIVAGSRADLGERNGRALVIDVETGKIERWGDHLLPAAPYPRLFSGDPGNAPAPGSLATRLFFTGKREDLVELVAPGKMRRVLPAR